MNEYKLELVDIKETDDDIQLIFIDNREVHIVKWNKRKFNKDTNGWDDSPEKIEQIRQWCTQYLGCDYEDMESAIGKTFTVYSYPTFDSLWEVASRFDMSMKGQFIQAEIERVHATETCIEIWYRYEGGLYVSRMHYRYEIGDEVYVDTLKKRKRFEEFKTKFGCTVEQAEEGALAGKTINVLVKAFGKNAFGDIQSLVMIK